MTLTIQKGYIRAKTFNKWSSAVTQDQNTKELAKKVRARKRFLDKITHSVTTLVHKRGRILEITENSCNIHVVSELQNFGGFTFHTDLGQTMFGGNTVKVYYHPGRSFREGGLDSAHDQEWTPVLVVDFQTDRDYVVKEFSDKAGWQKTLISVLKNENKIAAQAEKARSKVNNRLRKQAQNDEGKGKLIQEAQTLGLN